MKINELIKSLIEMEKSYGNLDVVITVNSDKPTNVMSSELIFLGYNQIENGKDEIELRSFPY